MEAAKPAVSAVICTYNPRPDIFAQVLDSIAKQTLPKDQFELIIIDNNSNPRLNEAELNKGRDLPLRVIFEGRQGNVFARQTGVAAATADVIVFVDDDNIMDPDYFELGLKIANAEPTIGAFGGVSRGHVEGGPVNAWRRKLLPFVGVRDHGKAVITSNEDRWGEWEPIGAGMVFRKSVADKYREMVETILHTHTLGRQGGNLMAGEDSLIARAAYRVGLSCSYQPDLKFTHFIKASRMKFGYLARLMNGHGRSVVALNRVLGHPTTPITFKELVLRFGYRIMKEGPVAGLVWWCWDYGFYAEGKVKKS